MFRHVGKRPSQGEILVAIQGLQRSLSIRWQEIRGRAPRRVSEDRRVLEQQILPAYAREPGITRVLFAGCASYTQHYEALFAGHKYWSIDPVAARQRHGARRHITDSLQHLAIHVPAGYFDLIVCNGVLGWGLNARKEADAAFAACHAALREGGHLLMGWNDYSRATGRIRTSCDRLHDSNERHSVRLRRVSESKSRTVMCTTSTASQRSIPTSPGSERRLLVGRHDDERALPYASARTLRPDCIRRRRLRRDGDTPDHCGHRTDTDAAGTRFDGPSDGQDCAGQGLGTRPVACPG
jgi:SAM-dependent methyltransferase